MRIELLGAVVVVGICGAAVGQRIAIDPNGVGATDVEGRLLTGFNQVFAPLPADPSTFFDPITSVWLRVGAGNGPGEMLFVDAGRVPMRADVGALPGGPSTIDIAGATDVFGESDWRTGGASPGHLMLRDGANLDQRDTLTIGHFEPGTALISSGATMTNDELSIGSDPNFSPDPPLDGRLSWLTVDGDGTSVDARRARTGGHMDSRCTVRNGARMVAGIFIIGSITGDKPRGSTSSQVVIDGPGSLLGVASAHLGYWHDGEIVVRNGGRLQADTLQGWSHVAATNLTARLVVDGEGSIASVRLGWISAPSSTIDLEVRDGGVFESWVFAPRIDAEDRAVLKVTGAGSRISGIDGVPMDVPDLAHLRPAPFALVVGPGATASVTRFVVATPVAEPLRAMLTVGLCDLDVGAASRVIVSETLRAGGTLVIETAPGFTPSLGDVFDLYDADVFEGTWAAVATPALPTGLSWDLSQLKIDGTVAVVETCSVADIAAPFGIVDLDDVDAFITLFLAGDPAADFVAPFGIVDLDDADAFITAFLAGCP